MEQRTGDTSTSKKPSLMKRRLGMLAVLVLHGALALAGLFMAALSGLSFLSGTAQDMFMYYGGIGLAICSGICALLAMGSYFSDQSALFKLFVIVPVIYALIFYLVVFVGASFA